MILCSSLITLVILGQARAPIERWPTGWLTPAEISQVENAVRPDARIKVYESASKRHRDSLHALAKKHDFTDVPARLNAWLGLLEFSLKDIQANINPKKKSKALIKYEIQLRKAILDVQAIKLQATVEHQEAFDSFLGRAEAVRKKFVDILFQR